MAYLINQNVHSEWRHIVTIIIVTLVITVLLMLLSRYKRTVMYVFFLFFVPFQLREHSGLFEPIERQIEPHANKR